MPESSLSATPIFSARPTLRIAGQDEPRASSQLLAMTMAEREGGMSSLELRLLNWVATTGGPPELAFDGSSAISISTESGDVPEKTRPAFSSFGTYAGLIS